MVRPEDAAAPSASDTLLLPLWYGATTTMRVVQTRYLILASLVTGFAILAAGAIWFSSL